MVELRTSIPHNGWCLGDLAEIEAQNCNFALNCHIAKTNVLQRNIHALHILPKRFVKIRHYGFLSSTWKRKKLKNLQQSLHVIVVEKREKTPLQRKCSCCKTGNLHTILVFDGRGPPAAYIGISQKAVSCIAS